MRDARVQEALKRERKYWQAALSDLKARLKKELGLLVDKDVPFELVPEESYFGKVPVTGRVEYRADVNVRGTVVPCVCRVEFQTKYESYRGRRVLRLQSQHLCRRVWDEGHV